MPSSSPAFPPQIHAAASTSTAPTKNTSTSSQKDGSKSASQNPLWSGNHSQSERSPDHTGVDALYEKYKHTGIEEGGEADLDSIQVRQGCKGRSVG